MSDNSNSNFSFESALSRRHFNYVTQEEKDNAIEYVLGCHIPFSLKKELDSYIDRQLEEIGVCLLMDNKKDLDCILVKYGQKIGPKSVVISRHGLIKS